MKNARYTIYPLLLFIMQINCTGQKHLAVKVYETSSVGNKLSLITKFSNIGKPSVIEIFPDQTFQTIQGFGGSFTESSAYLLNKISPENRKRIIEAYFGESGARYSLTRTHMNSCDFSLSHYSYAPIEGDKNLEHFSIDHDTADLIPMIKEAMAVSKYGFKILSSPWTAPPWMKDNRSWTGGKLLPEYYDTWALFFSKYTEAYHARGIEIWGFTVENEPLGNDNNWESMHFTAKEMTHFVNNYLGPKLELDGHDVVILGYDQNRGDELIKWADVMYHNKKSSKYFDGTAIHWYASTYEVFPESLQYLHHKAPQKHIIQSEACLDGIVPKWKDDQWYWSKEARDWGWTWASPENKYLHPEYVPVFRYARDIIGCLNNWVEGWIDWNMVLDKQGGPNWFKNWCGAAVLVDPDNDELYFTPLYYVMAHFSKYIRPEAKRIGFVNSDIDLLVTAAQNPDGSIVLLVLNQNSSEKSFELRHDGKSASLSISAKALQTIVITNQLHG